MDYQRIYDELIAHAVQRNGHPATIYRKKAGHANHHIRPASWFEGGRKNPEANQPANLCFLTHREHFLGHWLLAKLHGGRMAHAFAYMCSNGRYTGTVISSRIYERYLRQGIKARSADPEWHRRNAEACRKRGSDPEWLARITEENRLKAQDPRWQEQHAAGMEKRNAHPDWGKKHQEAIQKRLADPVYRKKISDQGLRRARLIVGEPLKIPAPVVYLKGTKQMRAYGFHPGNINLCLNGKNAHASGYRWRVATPEEMEQWEGWQTDPEWLTSAISASLANLDRQEWREFIIDLRQQTANQRTQKDARLVVGTPVNGAGGPVLLKGAAMMRSQGFHHNAIYRCLNGQSKAHLGYTWRYATPEEIEAYKNQPNTTRFVPATAGQNQENRS